MKSTRTIKKKLNEEQMVSEIESLNPIKPQSEKKPTTETPNEKLIEPRWKGSLPTVLGEGYGSFVLPPFYCNLLN